MKAHTQSSSTAEYAGATIGRVWRKWLRQEQRLVGWVASQGLPTNAAKAVPRVIKLLVVAVLLYAATWLGLLLIFGVFAVWAARNAGWNGEENQPEWRNGWEGYGLYRGGVRIDGGSADDDE